MRRGVKCLTGKISSVCNSVCDKMSPFVREWFEDNKSIWKLVLRCGWGLVWSMYVCFVLVGLLVTAALISGLIMRFLVAEPIRIEDKLNFDYTKHGPAAYLPVSSCAGADCGMKCGGMVVDCGETNRGSDAVSSSFGTETTKVKILQLSWQDACTSGLRKVQQDPAFNLSFTFSPLCFLTLYCRTWCVSCVSLQAPFRICRKTTNLCFTIKKCRLQSSSNLPRLLGARIS